LNCRRDQWLIGPDADLKSRESSSGTVILRSLLCRALSDPCGAQYRLIVADVDERSIQLAFSRANPNNYDIIPQLNTTKNPIQYSQTLQRTPIEPMPHQRNSKREILDTIISKSTPNLDSFQGPILSRVLANHPPQHTQKPTDRLPTNIYGLREALRYRWRDGTTYTGRTAGCLGRYILLPFVIDLVHLQSTRYELAPRGYNDIAYLLFRISLGIQLSFHYQRYQSPCPVRLVYLIQGTSTELALAIDPVNVQQSVVTDMTRR
jgi:hypothetical protein